MNDYGKSDNSIVPEKFPNKTPKGVAEEMEERALAKGNLPKQNVSRTLDRTNKPSAFERLRQTARRDKKQRLTALSHHVYSIERLRTAYFAVKRNVAPGIDGETWQHYGENLNENLQNLSNQLKRGAYRAKPVRRTYIPKADMAAKGRSDYRFWRTRSSKGRWLKFSMPSTSRIFSIFRKGFDHAAISIKRWKYCL